MNTNPKYDIVTDDLGGGGVEVNTTTNFSQSEMGNNPSVNLATGRFRYAFEDISVGYGNFAINVGHVFANKKYSAQVDKFKSYGNNWKLNVSQCVVKEGSGILYLDEVGEVHRFVNYDTNRYYDERNARVTLEENYYGYVIKDGVGNELIFDANSGLLINSVSCQNPAIEKSYVYDSNNRLIGIWDNRTVNKTSKIAQTRIELSYDNNGRLAAMTAYVKFNKKLCGITYEYNGAGNLICVNKVAYDRKSQECVTAPQYKFSYTSTNMKSAVECKTGTAYEIEYLNGRTSEVRQGVIKTRALSMGVQDKDGNPLAYCGEGLNCGAFTETEFVKKSSNAYSYNFTVDDTVSCETDITNGNGITLAYFINRNAEIVSSFEKTGNNLKTLQKQGEKRTVLDSIGGVTTVYINGAKVSAKTGATAVLNNAAFEITRNEREQGMRRFNYSFWLKLESKCELLEAKLTYKFTNGSEKTSVAYADGNAIGSWQRVSLTLDAPLRKNDDTKTETLESMSVQLLDNKQAYTGKYSYAEIGFSPAPKTETLLASNYAIDVPYTGSNSVNIMYLNSQWNIALKTLTQDKETYFTETDIVASYTNMYARKYNKRGESLFDAVCNNGTKLIPNVSALKFSNGSGWTATSNKPFEIVMTMPDGKTKITTQYIYNEDSMTVQTTGTSENASSVTKTVVDYRGKTLTETDEYNVTKQYAYDVYGNLTSVQVVGSDGVVGAATYYHYDDEGRLMECDDGQTGQKVEYNDYDQVGKVTERVKNGTALQDTAHSVENKYGIFRDNCTEVTEHDDGKEAGRNTVTYENGRIRTVTDGAVKYGIRYDLGDSKVEYTQFDAEGRENVVQRDRVSKFWEDDYETLLQTHTSEYLDENEENLTSVSTDVDVYGRVSTIRKSKGFASDTFDYLYRTGTESAFAQKPYCCYKYGDRSGVDYTYDDDGNLTGWEQFETEDSNTKRQVVSVRKLTDNATEFKLGEGIFNQNNVIIGYDTDKLIAPRITDFINTRDTMYDQHYLYDNFGRIKEKNNSDYSKYVYEYTSKNGLPLILKVGFSNNCDKNILLNGVSRVFFEENLDYTNQGDLKTVDCKFSGYSYDKGSSELIKVDAKSTKSYTYDNLHRLKSEKSTALGIDRSFNYYDSGRMKSIVNNSDGVTQSFEYDLTGKLSAILQGNSDDKIFQYDNHGNCISVAQAGITTRYGYRYGGELASVDKKIRNVTTNVATYEYNVNGARSSKKSGNDITKYIYDGHKILGEDRTGAEGDNLSIRYFYDNEGIVGATFNGILYLYVRDSQGNIVLLLGHDKRICARYEYDAFGRCKVYDVNNNLDIDPTSIGNINPIRWKGQYYDVDTALYYITGNYYDPSTGRFLNALPISETLNGAYLTRSLDRSGLMCNNVLEYSRSLQDGINTSDYLSAVTTEMLMALPSIPQWFAISSLALNNVLDLSVYLRTAWYMRQYPEIIGLMKLDGQVLLPGKYTKFVNVLAYSFVALDTIMDIYTNIQRNKPVGYIIGSAVYTAATGVGIVWVSGKVGAAIGTGLGGPYGTIIGGLLGILLGGLLTLLANIIKGEIFK